jgi:hypothetical protein
MRKRLKKRVHMAIDCSPYCYQYFSYCRGMIRAQFMDFRKFNDDEKLVTCKACKKDIKRQNRLMQAERLKLTTYGPWQPECAL